MTRRGTGREVSGESGRETVDSENHVSILNKQGIFEDASVMHLRFCEHLSDVPRCAEF